MKRVLMGTGHRPDKLHPNRKIVYSIRCLDRLTDLAVSQIKKIQPDYGISGMAMGWDMALAQAFIRLEIPFEAAIPFKNQPIKWFDDTRTLYYNLLEKADKITFVDEIHKYCGCNSVGEYQAFKMQKRNEYMIDQANCFLALWDGSKGGTGNCINYLCSTYKVKSPDEIENYKNVWDVWVKYNRL